MRTPTADRLTGSRVRRERLARKLSQVALAKAAGISASYLNLIEHNRRGIAGRHLVNIARALGVEVSLLTDGPERALAARVQEALGTVDLADAAGEGLEEFIGRFPVHARALARLSERIKGQRQELLALSDRMNADPFFAEAMHLMVTGITAIRTTAELLAGDSDMPPGLRQRFLSNLLAEAGRLSESAYDVLEHFEPAPAAGEGGDEAATGALGFETWMEQQAFHLPAIEAGEPPATAHDLGIEAGHEARLADALLRRYARAAAALPLTATWPEGGVDPLALGRDTGLPLQDVFFRLAHLPRTPDRPGFGYLETDGSGAAIYRRPLATFSLPRVGSACPLWPVYRALGQPGQPVAAMLDMPTGERVMALAIASAAEPASIGLPPQMRAAMAVTADYDLMDRTGGLGTLPRIAAGFQCTLCPRPNCDGRRADSVIG